MSDDQIKSTVQISLSDIKAEHDRLLRAAREQLTQAAGTSGTAKLNKGEGGALQLPHVGAFGLRVGDAQSYQVLPKKMEAEATANPQLPRWRIELFGLAPNIAPVGIDVCGDVVLGRTGNEIDFDLSPYGAAERGVSRRHALLRPSANKLYLIDLESTNGSRCNSVDVNGAKALTHNDTISLGNFTFQVKIIDSR
jgi:hypothetical protein